MAKTSFPAALRLILKLEGSYVDNPADPGGATKYGITHRTLAAWRGAPVTKADVAALTIEEAGQIYRREYWDRAQGNSLPAGLDLALFDFAVNSGPVRAVRSLQACLEVTPDGVVGPQTLGAMLALPPATVIRRLCAARVLFLGRLPHAHMFLKGWRRRVETIEREALRLAGGASPPLVQNLARNVAPIPAVGGDSAVPSASILQPQPKQMTMLDLSKSILSSRTIWANAIGLGAFMLSMLEFDASGIDKNALTEAILQIVTAGSFIASAIFRVLASKRIA